MGEPEEAADPEGHSELASHIIIVEGFVVPISISEHNGAHVGVGVGYKYNY